MRSPAALLFLGLSLALAGPPAAAQTGAAGSPVEAARQQNLAALGRLLAREPSLPPALLAAEAPSDAVGAALAAIAEGRERASIVGRVHRLTSDLAALSLRGGDGGPAATFAAYSTAAINVMLADIARRYDAEGARTIAASGRLGDFILNAGRAAALAESRLGEAGVPLDLQLDTAARLSELARRGQLDGATQAEVVTLWNTHRMFEPRR